MRDFFTVLPTPKTLRANESYNKKGGKTVFRYLFVLPSSSSFMGTTGQDALGEGTRENQRRRRVKGGEGGRGQAPSYAVYSRGGIEGGPPTLDRLKQSRPLRLPAIRKLPLRAP